MGVRRRRTRWTDQVAELVDPAALRPRRSPGSDLCPRTRGPLPPAAAVDHPDSGQPPRADDRSRRPPRNVRF